ncbi:MAG: PDZ domain-containing protein [Bacteroidetes bacterium]|nr:PDZ domain-containing protein [Bacteroidota bacterium]
MKRLWLILPALLLLPFFGDVSTSATQTGGDDDVILKLKGAWLGVKIKDVSDEVAKEAGLKETKGALVYKVVEESPADSAGIEEGDIIIAFNNIEIEDADALVTAVGKADPGSMATVTLMRDGKQMTLDVRLSSARKHIVNITRDIRLPRSPRAPRIPSGLSWDHSSSYGLVIESLGEQLGAYFGVPEGKGVLVKEVEEDSDAAKAGFQAGDVIVRAGKKTVEDVQDFKHVLGAYDPGEKIPVQILRKGKDMTIELTAKEIEEHRFHWYGQGNGPRIFRYYHDGEDGESEGLPDAEEIEEIIEGALEGVEDMDIDIDVDMDDMREGMRELRIMLNGEQIEMRDLQEKMREMMKDLKEKIEVEVDDGTVRIRTRMI